MFILSDIHGEKELMKPFLLSEEKYCLQLGDFGFIWKNNDWKYNRFLRHFERDYPNKIIFTILGNHENYDSIEKMKRKVICGARCRVVKENVFAVERGEILEIEGKKILCMGGANSTDAAYRIPTVSWWYQEEITEKDLTNAFTKVKECDKIDLVISHCMPDYFMYKVYSYPESYPSSAKLDKLVKYLFENNKMPEKWVGGHIHQNLRFTYADCDFEALDIGQSN